MAWTDQMVEDLRAMWKEGLTTAEIGKKLGVSKNSIVGKVHRLGLSGRPSPIKKKENDEASEAKEVAEVKAPAEPKAEKAPAKKAEPVKTEKISDAKSEKMPAPKADNKKGAVSLMDLDNHTCRWPLGDPKDENFHFCGKKVKIGQTYCEEHSNVAYVKTTKK